MSDVQALYHSAGTLTRIGSGDNLLLEGIKSIDGSGSNTVNLFTDLVAATDTINIGGGGIGGSVVTVGGDLAVTGDETVTGDTVFGGNTQIGDAATDTLDVQADIISDLNFDGTNQAVTNDGTGTLGLLKSGTSGDVTVSNAATAGNVVLTSTNGDVRVTSGALNVDTSFDFDGSTFDVEASGAISLDGGGASNFTTSAGSILIDAAASTLTLDGNSGVSIAGNAAEIDLTTSGVIDINGTGGVTIDATSTDIALTTTTAGDVDLNSANDILADAANAISLDAAVASNFTTASGALTLDGDDGVNIVGNTGEVDITTSGVVDINGTGGVTVDATSTDIALTTTTAGDIDLNSANDVLVDADAGISLGAAAASDFTVSSTLSLVTTGANELDITSGAAVDINAAAAFTIDGGAASSLATSVGDITIQPFLTTQVKGGAGIALTGTMTTASGADTLEGVGASTLFTTELEVGDAIKTAGGQVRRIATIIDADSATVSVNWASTETGVAATKDDDLLEVVNANGDVRLTMDKNGSLTATRGQSHSSVLTIANEEDSLDAALFIHNATPEGVITGKQGDLCMTTAGGGLLYFCDADGTNWTAVGSATGNTLQQAYDAGNAIQLVDTEGDMTIDTDDTGDRANFIVQNEAQSAVYLATDSTNAQLELGHANITVGFIGEVDTNMTFETSGGAKSITTDGTNGLTVSTSADAALTLTSATAATWSTTAGGLILDGASGVQLQGNAGEIDLTTSGVVDINGTGGVSVDATSTDIALTTTTAGDIDLNSANDVLVDADNAISLDSAAASNFTTSSGALTLDGDDGVNIVGNTGEIDLTTTGNIDVNGNLILIDSTSGIAIGTAADKPIDMNASTFDLDASGALTIDSATSIAIGTTADKPIDIDASSFDLDASSTISLVSTAASLTLTGAATSAWSLSAGNLTIDAVGGTTLIDSGTGTTIDADAGGVTISATAGGVTVAPTAGDVDITAPATSDLNLLATNDVNSDISLGARGGTITLNESGETTLDSGYFTATSIIGALNELADDVTGVTGTYAIVNAVVIAVGDLCFINDVGGTPRVALASADNATAEARKPIGICVVGGTGDVGGTVNAEILLSGEGVVNSVLAAGDVGNYVFMQHDDVAAGLVVNAAGAPSDAGDTVLRVGICTLNGAAGTATIAVSFGMPVTL